MFRRGFSLLETLIAAGVMTAVIMGVIALSNSLIVGTVVNADKTIINRWAAEGIELTEKIRNDRILDKTTSPDWFLAAIKDSGFDYGWYKLSSTYNKTWSLTKTADTAIDAESFMTLAESLTSDQTTGYRLICVEAISASAVAVVNDNKFYCNSRDGKVVQDGLRSNLTTCQQTGGQDDLYCQMTKESVNKNRLNSNIIIPPGNAVKIRSVVIWQDKSQIRQSSIGTIITNWKGYEQN